MVQDGTFTASLTLTDKFLPPTSDRQHLLNRGALFLFSSINGEERMHPLEDRPSRQTAYQLRLKLKNVIRTIAFLSTLLTFVETPKWCKDNVLHAQPCDSHLYPSYPIPFITKDVNGVLEVLLLLPLLLDNLCIFHAQGFQGAIQTQRQVLRFATLAIYSMELGHTYLMNGYWGWFRLAPYWRIIIFVSYTHEVEVRLRLIAMMLPGLVPLLLLITTFIFSFAWFAVLLFPQDTEEGKAQFAGLWNAMWNLLILITTANFPDVMMPAYKENRATFLFFLAFVGMGVFLLINVVTAVVFNSFTAQKESHQNGKERTKNACREESFKALAKIDGNPKELSMDTMRALMKALKNYHDIGHIGHVDIDKFLQNLDDDGNGRVTRDEFEEVIVDIRKSITGHTPPPPFLIRRWPSLKQSARWKKFQDAVAFWDYPLVDIILVFSVGLAFAESVHLGLLSSHINSEAIVREANAVQHGGFFQYASFAFWNNCITCLFVVEVIAKILAWGFEQYWHRLMNKYDFCITVLTAGLSIAVLLPNDFNDTRLIRCAAMLRIGRIMRLMLHGSHTFRVTANTFLRIIPDLFGIMKVLFCAMYFFSFLGMQLFGGVINTDPNSPYSARVAETDFATADYYPNNFNDMPSGMVTLFELIVVNNWFEIVDGFTAAVGEWAAAYFITWYIFGVLIVMNIVVAFVLNSFVDEFQKGMLSVGDQTPRAKSADGSMDFEGDIN